MTPMRVTTTGVAQYEELPAEPASRRLVKFTRNQIIIIAACAVALGVVAGILAAISPPRYETTRAVILLSGSNPNDNEVLTVALESIVKSKHFAAEVKRRGGFDESIDKISATIGARRKPLSAFLEVTATHEDREFSEAVSAQVIPSLSAIFESAQDDVPVQNRIRGAVFKEAFPQPLQSTVRFPIWFAGIFGALLGGLVPFFVFLTRNMRQPVLESTSDITDALDLPVLARIPSLRSKGAKLQDSVAGVVTAVERLSLNEPVHRLVLVGADDGNERAEITLALACVIARSFGQPVALIDADLDRLTLTNMVNMGDRPGLAECLAGQMDPKAALQPLRSQDLPDLLSSLEPPEGMVRFMSAGIDTSRNVLRMRSTFNRVLEGLAGRYVVVVNGPRLPGPVPISQLLSLADATLMVVSEGQTSISDARSAAGTFRSFSSDATGIIVVRD